jgi:hypothetical protein
MNELTKFLTHRVVLHDQVTERTKLIVIRLSQNPTVWERQTLKYSGDARNREVIVEVEQSFLSSVQSLMQ